MKILKSKNIENQRLRNAITGLCKGDYTLSQVNLVVTEFCHIAKKFVFQKSYRWNILEGHKEPELEMTKKQIIQEVIYQVEMQFLQKYLQKKKLKPKECAAFKSAISLMLTDIQYGVDKQSYFNYLNEVLKFKLNKKLYRVQYRTQFEYVAKESKKIFSAIWKKECIH